MLLVLEMQVSKSTEFSLLCLLKSIDTRLNLLLAKFLWHKKSIPPSGTMRKCYANELRKKSAKIDSICSEDDKGGSYTEPGPSDLRRYLIRICVEGRR
jgi:hypothetical protein